VFWTKNPAPFLPLLKTIDRQGIPYYFHFTLNDYESEGFERGVPPLPERIETFKRLAGMIGPERVLWRFDPLIATNSLGPEQIMVRIRRIGDLLAAYTERLTISFMTEYVKVMRNLRNAGITSSAWNSVNKAALLDRLAENLITWNIRGVTCAEGSNDERFGIQKGKCIDDGLARRLWGNDERLMRFLDAYAKTKDKGQRPCCQCVPSKDIGRYDTCGHQCCYCYANASPRAAFDNRTFASDNADAIIG
jgi:DNA repair photolyase